MRAASRPAEAAGPSAEPPSASSRLALPRSSRRAEIRLNRTGNAGGPFGASALSSANLGGGRGTNAADSHPATFLAAEKRRRDEDVSSNGGGDPLGQAA